MSSDLVVLETLVKPLRDGDTVVEALFRALFEADEVELIPATRETVGAGGSTTCSNGIEDTRRTSRGDSPALRVHAVRDQ